MRAWKSSLHLRQFPRFSREKFVNLGKVNFLNLDLFLESFSFFFENYPAKSEIKSSVERLISSFFLNYAANPLLNKKN